MKTIFTKDLPNKKMYITREFAASRNQVWQAWTDPVLLDQWWAPKPWQARTKHMDFNVGGYWLYCMQGPDGTQSWGRADYKAIDTINSFEGEDIFCDDHGMTNDAFPKMYWKNLFSDTADGNTMVSVEVTYASQADLEKIIEMGFETGFSMAHENLDEMLASLNPHL